MVWDRVAIPADPFGQDLIDVDDIVATSEGYVAVGRVVDSVSPQDPATTRIAPPTDGAIWTSPDLVTWTRVDHARDLFGGPDDEQVRDVAAVDGGLVAIGSTGGHGSAWASAEGRVWLPTADASGAWLNATPEALVRSGAHLIAVGGDAHGMPAVWLGGIDPPATAGDGIDQLVDRLSSAGVAVSTSRSSILRRSRSVMGVAGCACAAPR